MVSWIYKHKTIWNGGFDNDWRLVLLFVFAPAYCAGGISAKIPRGLWHVGAARESVAWNCEHQRQTQPDGHPFGRREGWRVNFSSQLWEMKLLSPKAFGTPVETRQLAETLVKMKHNLSRTRCKSLIRRTMFAAALVGICSGRYQQLHEDLCGCSFGTRFRHAVSVVVVPESSGKYEARVVMNIWNPQKKKYEQLWNIT